MSKIEKFKNKKTFYVNKKPTHHYPVNLEANMKGFLCTCNMKEKECIQECYNLLNAYSDKLYPAGTKEVSTEDGEESLDSELKALKESKHRKFQNVKSGAKNVLFIKTTLDNPTELVEFIANDIYQTKQQKTRYLLRLIPVEITCKAFVEDIKVSFSKIVEKYFGNKICTFSIIFNHRNNDKLSRDEVIKALAEEVTRINSGHKADLKNPELAIIVEIIRNIAFLSVVSNYVKYKKLNLLAVATSDGSSNEANKESCCENSAKSE